MGSPPHHGVRLRRGTGRTGTDHVHRHHTELIGRTYRETIIITNLSLGVDKAAQREVLSGVLTHDVFLFRANDDCNLVMVLMDGSNY